MIKKQPTEESLEEVIEKLAERLKNMPLPERDLFWAKMFNDSKAIK